MGGPISRGGAWWHQRPDGSWLRWNESAQTWEESSTPPPPDPYGQGPPPPGQGWQTPPQARVPTYLVPAILTTVFCCLPAGIVAIVYAAQVNTKLNAGDFAGAMEASKNAKIWSWISFGVTLAALVVAGVAGIAAESGSAG